MNLPLERAARERTDTDVETVPAPAKGANGDFGVLVRRTFRALRYVSLFMVAVSAIVIGREVKGLFDAAYGFHPVAGYAFLALVAAALWFGAVRPLRRYWLVPAAVRPPANGKWADADLHAVARRARFLAKVADNLARNPRLAGLVPEIMLARVEADRIESAARENGAPLDIIKRDLRTLETVRFESIFRPLDSEANQVIRGEALAVGLGTAVSMNGTLDAWIVMWRNLSLVSKLASVYYGRPGVRGTLFVIRDVATAMFLATRLQGAMEGAANFLGGWFGRAGGALVGPAADGAVNALITVRIGYVAKARCRSFQVWNDATLGDILVGCFKEAASHGKGVVVDVFRGAKGGLRRVSGEVWQRATGLVSKFFPKPPGDPLGDGS